TPIPPNQLTAATTAQTSAIARLRQRPTTQALSLVTVNTDALQDNSTQISIPSMATLMLSRRNEELRSPTDFTWYGTLSGGPGQAILVVHDGNITGIIQDERAVYKIEPIGNGVHALIKVDQARFPPDDPPVEQRSDISPTAPREATSTGIVIDVMVPYTT